jgi:hypothetical protein
LHEDMNQLFRYEDTVSNTQREMHYDFNRWFSIITYFYFYFYLVNI